MWCKSCRQDVPGIASLEEGAFHCARCGGRVGRKRMLVEGTLTEDICDQGIDLTGDEAPANPAEALHQWADDEQLQKAKRLLRPLPSRRQQPGANATDAAPRLRFDPPSSDSLRIPLPKTETKPQAAPARSMPAREAYPAYSRTPAEAHANSSFLSTIGWGLVSLGLMGMVCGGVLMAWSIATGRAELWTMGLPIGLIGQGGLLVGMLFAILGKRDNPAQATGPVPHRNVPSQAHPVGYPAAGEPSGSGMLAELKGQLDMLSAQLASREAASERPWF